MIPDSGNFFGDVVVLLDTNTHRLTIEKALKAMFAKV